MDDDLLQMSREQLIAEPKRLREGIRTHASGHPPRPHDTSSASRSRSAGDDGRPSLTAVDVRHL